MWAAHGASNIFACTSGDADAVPASQNNLWPRHALYLQSKPEARFSGMYDTHMKETGGIASNGKKRYGTRQGSAQHLLPEKNFLSFKVPPLSPPSLHLPDPTKGK